MSDQENIPAIDMTPEEARPAQSGMRKPAFAKVENPKDIQFTARATADEADQIDEAIEANRREGEPMDIVRLVLKLLAKVETDNFPFQTFKTRVKGYVSRRRKPLQAE